MIQLNLPEYAFKIRQDPKGNQIFDGIRKKFVSCTPEEWVRQNFIQYIIAEKNYPPALIAVETGLKYHRLKKRSDITVYDKSGKIWMVIECKSPEVKLSQDTFNQAAIYNVSGKTKTKFLAITNGLKHYCCEMNYEQNKYHFLKDFPPFY